MYAAFRRALVLLLVLLPMSAFAFSDWQDPTPAELSMKSYPANPDAPAVFLYREETVDDNLNMHSMYARIKILTEKGKEIYSDIEIPYEAKHFNIDSVAGRTIHSDGTVVPFTGKPYEKLLVKQGNERIMAKVFSMPDVQVGSIIEYRYKLRYDDNIVLPPHWLIQQKIPVLKARYSFVVSSSLNGTLHTVLTEEFGHQLAANGLLYSTILPPGDTVKQNANGTYVLDIENVPPLPNEDYLPPIRSLSYRVIFYYTPFRSRDEYWETLGKYWSESFDHFARPSGQIQQAVSGIVAPGDNDLQKLQKIYAAVMKLDNTSFTREHTATENKAEGLQMKSAEDVWTQKRGNEDQITRLFVAMARAAGLKAYGAIVVNRDNGLFDENLLSWDQLDDELAVVEINGKEVYFDPGQRYCEFGKLHWKHTWAGGVREMDHGTDLFHTPGMDYKSNGVDRFAELTLDANGQVHGIIRETMTGAQALAWRQAALRQDETAVMKDYEKIVQRSMPPGVQIKMNHFIGLSDYTTSLMAVLDVSGMLGTKTGKHVFLPAVFFEAGNPPRFAETHREDPVDLHYPYMIHDQFQVTLPPDLAIDSLPQGGDVPFAPNADYLVKFVTQGNIYAYGRLLRVANMLYQATEYPALRTFFQKASADDQQQVALKLIPVAAASPAAKTTAPAAGK